MLKKPTILLVEDDNITRDIVAAFLAKDGFDVVEASRGVEALMIIKLKTPVVDWLFTDINLSDGIDGFLLGEEFRLRYPFRPVVYASVRAHDFARPVPHAVFFRKPYRPAQIAAAFATLQRQTQQMDTGRPAP